MIQTGPQGRVALRRGWRAAAVCLMLSPAFAYAKATIVTLSELTKQSDVIVYGYILPVTDSASVSTAAPLSFTVLQVLKGASDVRDNVVALCNSRPTSEWPDLSKLKGDAVLFLARKGGCLELSHSYRSMVRITSEGASTVAIRGQAQFQPLDTLLAQVRRRVSK